MNPIAKQKVSGEKRVTIPTNSTASGMGMASLALETQEVPLCIRIQMGSLKPLVLRIVVPSTIATQNQRMKTHVIL